MGWASNSAAGRKCLAQSLGGQGSGLLGGCSRWKYQPTRLQKLLLCLQEGHRELVILCRGREGNLHLCFLQIDCSLSLLPGSSLVLPGWHSRDGDGVGVG